MAVEDAYELAYREAVRALEHQRAEVTAVQSRAGMLLAAASVAVSLPARATLGAAGSLVWLAALCCAVSSLCVLAVVWPHEGRGFDTDPQTVLAAHLAAADADPTALRSDLIAHLASCRRANARRLVAMVNAFRIGACLLAIQLVLTVLAAAVIV